MPNDTTQPLAIWRLSKQGERRLTEGHPWVFANELAHKPTAIAPGTLIQLENLNGKTLGFGYGNPHSLIVYRKLCGDHEKHVTQDLASAVAARIYKAAKKRASIWGDLNQHSFRLCYGEADELPGLIIDVYTPEARGTAKIWVMQILTAGMERLMADVDRIMALFFGLCEADQQLRSFFQASQSCLILRRDVGTRKLEGLAIEEPAVIANPLNLTTEKVWVSMRPAGADAVSLCVDLTGGQKTGLFLDQQWNTMLACQFLHGGQGSDDVRILDLFSHVGQWGVQLGSHVKSIGMHPKVYGVDASAKALELASLALEKKGLAHETLKADIIADAKSLYAGQSFDVVICDPPALIKNKKDIGAGTAAYRKVNEASLRLVKSGGLFISCTCSHHLDKQSFWQTLGYASQRARVEVDWLHVGGQSPDHPVSPLFPQGEYLKCAIGRVR